MSCSIVRVGLVTSCLLGMALLVGCQGESAKKPASPTKDATSGAKSDQSATATQPKGKDVAATQADDPAAVAAVEKFGSVERNAQGNVVSVLLASPEVTNDVLKSLPGMPSIESLDLSESAISDAGLEYVGKLTNLRTLTLVRVDVTDKGLAYLEGLKKLQRLSLTRCPQISDKGLESLGKLTNLRLLDLRGSRQDHGTGRQEHQSADQPGRPQTLW